MVNDLPALVIECSELAGLLADHVVLRWEGAGTVVEVSLHGHTAKNRDLIQEIGAEVEMVEPVR